MFKQKQLLIFHINYWKQRAKSKHLYSMDIISNYFHRVATGRRSRKIVKTFTTRNGVQITSEEEIRAQIKAEMEDRFLHSSINLNKLKSQLDLISNQVSIEDNKDLIRGVLNMEIKNAIFDMGSEKSPGLDGMPAGFYQKYWNVIGPTVIKDVKDFFRSGKILKQVNHTFITLIQKIDNTSSLNHFRPISLCTTIY